jgi:hypothetical protein
MTSEDVPGGRAFRWRINDCKEKWKLLLAVRPGSARPPGLAMGPVDWRAARRADAGAGPISCRREQQIVN